MDLMDFLGKLPIGDLAALAKGTISGDMRYELQAAEVVTNDRDLIKAAKAVFKFREKSEAAAQETATAAEAEQAAAEKAEAAAEAVVAIRKAEEEQPPAPGNAPDQEQEKAAEVAAQAVAASPSAKPVRLEIKDKLALAAYMLGISQKIGTFRETINTLTTMYNNGVRGAADRITIHSGGQDRSVSTNETINDLFAFLISESERRIKELESELTNITIY